MNLMRNKYQNKGFMTLLCQELDILVKTVNTILKKAIKNQLKQKAHNFLL